MNQDEPMAVTWNPLDATYYPIQGEPDPYATIEDPARRWRRPRLAHLACDLFAPEVTDEQVLHVWCVMEEAKRGGHTFYVTTAYPQRLRDFLRVRWLKHAEAWEEQADERRRNCPAAVAARAIVDHGQAHIVIALVCRGYAEIATSAAFLRRREVTPA